MATNSEGKTNENTKFSKKIMALEKELEEIKKEILIIKKSLKR